MSNESPVDLQETARMWQDKAWHLQREIERLTAQVKALESDDHEWYLQAERIAELEAALERSCNCEIYGMEPQCAACAALQEKKCRRRCVWIVCGL